MSDVPRLDIYPAKPLSQQGGNAVTVTKRSITGWLAIALTRSAEKCPNSFTFDMTEHYPGERDVIVSPGDRCEAYLGDDLVLTGYVDIVGPSLTPDTNSVSVAGRGKCQDLVDCSVVWPSGQISGTSVIDVAQKIADQYNINVYSDAPAGPQIPQFNVAFDDVCFAIIERMCRYTGRLCYEDEQGRLFLTTIGSVAAATGIKEGVNLQSGFGANSMHQRYSEYNSFLLSIATMSDTGTAGYAAATQEDDTVTRRRVKNVIAESTGGQISLPLQLQRVAWEMNRRNGRSRSITATVDSWRDGAGKLWAPNTLIDIVSPTLKINTTSAGEKKWVIAQVVYKLDGNSGTTAEITAMPQLAFQPQPQLLVAPYLDVPLVADPPRQ